MRATTLLRTLLFSFFTRFGANKKSPHHKNVWDDCYNRGTTQIDVQNTSTRIAFNAGLRKRLLMFHPFGSKATQKVCLTALHHTAALCKNKFSLTLFPSL